jgi:hypothetical protein
LNGEKGKHRLIKDQKEQLEESEVSSAGKGRKSDKDSGGSKVVASACVDKGSYRCWPCSASIEQY